MSFHKFPARRTFSVLALAIAAIAGPVAVAPGASADCTVTSTSGSTSLACQPTVVFPQGAATELYQTHSGNNAGVFGPGGPAGGL